MKKRDAQRLRKFFKALNDAGHGLPKMYQQAPAYYYRRAGDMTYEELTRVVADNDGKPLHEDQLYRLHNMIDVPINHVNRMKKYYKTHGLNGYALYIAELRRMILNHMERVKAKEDSELKFAEMKTLSGWLKFFERVKLILMMIFNLQVDWEEDYRSKKKSKK